MWVRHTLFALVTLALLNKAEGNDLSKAKGGADCITTMPEEVMTPENCNESDDCITTIPEDAIQISFYENTKPDEVEEVHDPCPVSCEGPPKKTQWYACAHGKPIPLCAMLVMHWPSHAAV